MVRGEGYTGQLPLSELCLSVILGEFFHLSVSLSPYSQNKANDSPHSANAPKVSDLNSRKHHL